MLDTLRLPNPKRAAAPWRRIALTTLLTAALTIPASAAAARSAAGTGASRARCHATWTEVPVPDHGDPAPVFSGSAGPIQSAAGLFAVAALSARDVRTAGMDQVFRTPPYDDGTGITDLERWDGTRWSRSPSASATFERGGGTRSVLRFLAFDSPTDGWAAGFYVPNNPLVEHWDGTRWTISPSLSFPFLDNPGGVATGLAAFSATDAWITVERRSGGGPQYGLLEHWDGTAWQFVDYPLEFSDAVPNLTALYGRAPDDMWLAAGVFGSDPGEVAMHWDGATWTVIPMPLPHHVSRWRINAISGASSDNLWAVGEYADATGFQSLTEHWDGAKWTLVPAPRPDGSTLVSLRSVSVTGSSDAWAVGVTERGPTPPGNKTDNLILHWDGAMWMVDLSASTSPDDASTLYSVSAVSATDVWAVGSRNVPLPQAGLGIENVVPQAYHYHCRG